MRYLVALAALFAAGCGEMPSSSSSNSTKAVVDDAATMATANGPFGIAMGGPIDSVSGAKQIEGKPGLYKLDDAPKPHPEFESLVLAAYPETGICMIRGIGKTNESDGAGSTIRTQIDGLAEALATKYGKGEKIDACGAGDIACAPEFWMMTMDNGERAYAHQWTKQNDTMKKTSIGEIIVAANSVNIQASFPILEFHSSKKDECAQAEKALSASAL